MKKKTASNLLRKKIFNKVVKLCIECGIVDIPSRPNTIGTYGEVLSLQFLRKKGHIVDYISGATGRGDFDLLVDGQKVEVKTAIKNPLGKYCFIIAKNIKDRTPLFDYLFLVFLENIDAQPVFIKLPKEVAMNRQGFVGDLKYYIDKSLKIS